MTDLTFLLLKMCVLLLAFVVAYFTKLHIDRIERKKYSLIQELTYKLENYKLYKKSDEDVAELEDFKEKVLNVINEEK